MGVLPLSKYTFYKCHLSPAVNDPAIKWKQRMMMVPLVTTSLIVMVAKIEMVLCTLGTALICQFYIKHSGTPPHCNFILL